MNKINETPNDITITDLNDDEKALLLRFRLVKDEHKELILKELLKESEKNNKQM